MFPLKNSITLDSYRLPGLTTRPQNMSLPSMIKSSIFHNSSSPDMQEALSENQESKIDDKNYKIRYDLNLSSEKCRIRLPPLSRCAYHGCRLLPAHRPHFKATLVFFSTLSEVNFFSCPEQLNRCPCPLVPWLLCLTPLTISLHNTTE